MSITGKQALKWVEKFQYAISLLTIHGLLPDGERDKLKTRLDKWALAHGLTRTTKGTR